MPCQDITEVLTLELDGEDRLQSYTLLKQTCGGGVGEKSLLATQLQHRPAMDILDTDSDDILANCAVPAESVEAFLHLKHFFAVQGGLAALLGLEPGGPKDICAIDTIEYHADGTSLTALVHIDVVAEKIKRCNNCRCSTVKKKKPETEQV